MARSSLRSFTPLALPAAVGALVAAALLGSNHGALAAPGAAPGLAQACRNVASIPPGFDYPQPAAVLHQWLATGNQPRAREHGWYLWAALNTISGGEPVWRSWCTSTQAFATGLSARSASAFAMNHQLAINAKRLADGPTRTMIPGEDPINFPNPPTYDVPGFVKARYPQCYDSSKDQLVDGPTFQNNGDIMVAGVIYNGPAYQWIRSRQLYLAANLNHQVPTPPGQAEISEMPAGSIILKPMMWPVPATGYTALPLWDDAASDHGTYAGFEIQNMWPRAAALTVHGTSQIATVDVTYLHGVRTHAGAPLGPITYRGAHVAPIDQFYHFDFPTLAGMAPCDRAILDQSAYWAYGRPFAAGDRLAIVAMHVMTKEQPAWAFQSVWWHDRPNAGPYAANRPNIPIARAPGPWRHYLMASTYGFVARPGQWPVAYNPYIELAADHPIRTNCMNCHHRAAWPGPKASYEAANGPSALAIYALNNPTFNGLLKVDSIWSISDRATGPSAKAPAGRARR